VVLFGSAACATPEYEDQVAARLEHLSFNNAAAPDELGKALAEMASGEIGALCDLLVAPGTGDDTKARMALHGLALHLGRDGSRAQRGRFVRALGQALRTDRPAAVKAFLIRQLQLAGDERAVRTLGQCLTDEELCEPAAQALLAIGGTQARGAFVSALPKATGRPRVTIVRAFTRLPTRRVVGPLLADAQSDDRELRLAALGALAEIGDPTTGDVLLNATKADSWQERAEATAFVLTFTRRLVEMGLRDHASGIYRELMESHAAPDEVHVRCAALHGLAHTRGAAAVGEVVAALTDENPELRAAAMDMAVGLAGRDVTDAYVRELRRASAAARAGILTVLARRGDEAALPAARAALTDGDKHVRIAAVRAVAALGRERGIEPLVTFLNTEQDDERRVAEDELVGLRGADVSQQLARWLPRAPVRMRVALIDVLARRKAQQQLDAIFAFVSDPQERVRVAAVNAVGTLADRQAVPALLRLLTENDAEPVRDAIENALPAICQRADSASACREPIIAAIDRDNVRDYCSLLRVLGRVGGAPALEALQEGARDARAEVKEAAIRAFSDWPDATAIEAMLSIAREVEETKHHVLAMRAYARLAAFKSDRPVEQTLKLFAEGLEAARRPEEKKLLLARLADVKDAHTLDMLETYLDDEALRSEAGSAMIGVAHGLLPAGWAPARTALEKVLARVEDQRVHRHAADVLKDVERHEDFITDWLVAGPYMVAGKRGHEIVEVPFPPEPPASPDVTWQRQPVSDDPGRFWFVDLNALFGGPHRAAYLRTYVWSPMPQDVRLELGSDDSVRVWLNQELIHTNKIHRGCAKGQDKIDARLKEGWNEVLLKVINDDGGWAACLRVRTPEGGHLDGLKVDADARP
jgi:HEAT repeat protein